MRIILLRGGKLIFIVKMCILNFKSHAYVRDLYPLTSGCNIIALYSSHLNHPSLNGRSVLLALPIPPSLNFFPIDSEG